MVSSIRKAYNGEFTNEKYNSFLSDLNSLYPNAIQFRLAETPVFIDKKFTAMLIEACEDIIDIITDASFLRMTNAAIPATDKVEGDLGFPETLVFDYGICINDNGETVPQLVEMQGFPSMYGFQAIYPDVLRQHFNIPSNFTQYLGGYNRNTYTKLLHETIMGSEDPANVILLEIKPHEQKTKVDFYCTRDLIGIQPVCITELFNEGDRLFYHLNGHKTPVNRIYNRVIFDELHARTDLGNIVDIRKKWNVKWVPHPDWFYRISKYTLPFISSPFVPQTFFLNELKLPPQNLDEYVLKPLFSFAGQGVVIDVTQNDIDQIKDPHNWILQKKVNYAPVIETPDGLAKAEIRIMYLWKEGEARPQPVINLARISKGKMIGTRYNSDKQWVGGSVAFFET